MWLLLGYEPKYDLDTMLKLTIGYYVEAERGSLTP